MDNSTLNASLKNRSILRRIFLNFTFWVLAAIISGILLGHFSPEKGIEMEIFGKIFVDIIKLFITPIIFLTIVLGISGIGDLKKVGRIGLKALFYFEVVSTLALVIGVAVAYILQPGIIDKSGLVLQDASKYTKGASENFSWLQFFLSNLTLQVLAVAIITGITLNHYKHRERTITILERLSKIVLRV